MRRIALFLPNWIGDVVMATPAIRAVRERHPHAHLIAVGRPYVFGVLDGSPWLNEFIPFGHRGVRSQRLLAVAGQLRKRAVDLALIFPNSFRSALAAWLGRCARRVGYARYGRSRLLTDRLQPICDSKGRFKPSPILSAYNLLAERAGCPVASNRMELFTTAADEELVNHVWNKFGLHSYPETICLNPGAAFGSAKLWPADFFAQLARQFVQRRGSGILVICGPAERQLARQIAETANHPAVHSLAQEAVSLGLTKACIKRADLLVSTDSGPRHFAAALNRPVVALFGPTHIDWTDTFYAREIQLQKAVPCGPCQLRTCPLDHRCMTELLPDEVYTSAVALLDSVNQEAVRHAG